MTVLDVAGLPAGSAFACTSCGRTLRAPAPKEPEPVEVVESVEEVQEVEFVEAGKPRPKPKRAVREFHEDDEPEEDYRRERRPRGRRIRKRRRSSSFDPLESMPMSYQAQANIGILFGILLNVIGFVVMRTLEPAGAFIALFIFIIALACWIWGFCAYARMKGYSAFLGLLGFLGLIGLIILVVLPYKETD
jgi:hypothetical protein